MGLPTLKVGLNELPEGAFEVAVTKLLRDPDAKKAARKAGHFAIEGHMGTIRVKRTGKAR
jgi:translation elongation factor EF-Ts